MSPSQALQRALAPWPSSFWYASQYGRQVILLRSSGGTWPSTLTLDQEIGGSTPPAPAPHFNNSAQVTGMRHKADPGGELLP